MQKIIFLIGQLVIFPYNFSFKIVSFNWKKYLSGLPLAIMVFDFVRELDALLCERERHK